MNKKQIETLLKLIDSLYIELENTDMKSIFKLHRGNRTNVLNRVADIVLKYNVSDNLMSLSVKEKIMLKRELSRLIQQIALSEYQTERAIINELLVTSAVERYYINNYFYSKEVNINYSLKKLSDKRIKEIINTKVEKKLWSDRLWKNKKALEKTLRSEIYDLIDGKTNINEISESVAKRYSQSYSNSRRLVRTESARVQETINEEWAKDNHIKKQMFLATLDNRTSEICREKDSTVWNFDDENKPIPPLHINCRSTLINLPDIKGYKPSARIDNITKKNVDYSTYKEWRENQ